MGKAALAGLIALFLALANAWPVAAPAQVRAAPPGVCVPKQDSLAELYEAAATAEPQSIPRQIDLARCYDSAWRFADAERAILRALELMREEIARTPRPTLAPGAPVPVGGEIPVPARTLDGRIGYPEDAAREGIRGVVAVEAIIDGRGRVRRTRIAESIPKLDLAAGDAVRRWQFAPTLVQGKPVDAVTYFFLRFGLPRELTPADWLDIARFYYGQRLLFHALTPLEAALGRERRDRERFADSPVKPTPGVIAEPKLLRRVSPEYPPVAFELGAEGTVVVEALLDRFGDVGRARITKSVPLFDAAAIDGVLQWEYTPVVVEGAPVTVLLEVTVHFRLR